MKRKDTLRSLLTATEPPAPSPPAQARVPAGAVRAMGLDLASLREDASQAQSLRAQVEAGAVVVELQPALIDASFAKDRLALENEEELRELVQSIADSGQQVPVLVRPHPEQPGRYQMAYGHRRLLAVRKLGLPLKAVVRPLTDDELVVAQGKENIERRNLTFIERALFAANLEQRGFDRPTLLAALAVQTAEMTRYLQVARAIPREVVQAIGPAPRTGRPRWLEMQRLFAHPQAAAAAQRVIAGSGFATLGSDSRFLRIFETLRGLSSAPAGDRFWRDGQGRPVVRIEQSPHGTRLSVDERLAPQFGSFLIGRLEALYAEFQQDMAGEGEGG